jgi:hypothetical protein
MNPYSQAHWLLLLPCQAARGLLESRRLLADGCDCMMA